MKQESQMSLKSLAQRFLHSQKGSITTMTALTMVPMTLAIGTAIDFGHYNTAQTHVQASLDAAALAGAAQKNTSDSQRIKAAEAAFALNLSQGAASELDVKGNFKIENKRMIATAEVEVPMTFMRVGGIDVLNGASRAEVGLLADKKAEIALVLDYSGSMRERVGGNVKYIAMKDAAKKLVTDLEKEDKDKVKFALVPFSHHVYTTLPASHVLDGTGSTWTGCTQDRMYPHNLSAATPTARAETKWNQPWAPEHADWGCKAYKDNNLMTLDLTKDFKAVKGKLDSMRPYQYTHIALGVEFGYHMLSPNAPFTNGAAFNDEDTKKFMVVLTDGKQTEPGFGPGGSRKVEDGEANLEKLCDSAKADGITMITMAFDLDDSDTRKRLEGCATDAAKHFFIADDSSDLAAAFEAVKSAITADIYLSK
jgi:hypothetical protein